MIELTQYFKKSYIDTFNKLYEVTNGSVILSGSMSLRYRNIIDRDINDLDVNILIDDWNLYKNTLQKHFRIHPNFIIKYDILHYEVYTCFDIKTKLNEFHLFVNYSNDIFDVINGIRLLKPSYHLIDKQMIYDSGQDVEKHLSDIESIKSYLNDK
jgi:hypothetical protein